MTHKPTAMPVTKPTKYRYSRIKDYTETMNGLLKTRGQLYREAECITERLGEIRNGMKGVDSTLRLLGYEGDLEKAMPRQRRQVRFGQGELLDSLMLELRCAERPLKSRELAQNIIAATGDDIRDRRAVTDLTRRISKCLRVQRESGVVIGQKDECRNISWVLRPRSG